MAELEKASSAQGLGDEAFMSVADLKAYVTEVEFSQGFANLWRDRAR